MYRVTPLFKARKGTPYNNLQGEPAPPERGTIFRLQFYERVGISLVEVYERVGKCVISVFKMTWKGQQKDFMAVKNPRKRTCVRFYQILKTVYSRQLKGCKVQNL